MYPNLSEQFSFTSTVLSCNPCNTLSAPFEVQLTTLRPHPLAVHIDQRQQHRCHRDDRSLNAKAHVVAICRAPRLLEISDTKPANSPREIEIRTNLPTTVGIAIECVRSRCDGCNHHADDVHAPTHDDSRVVEQVFQGLANDDQTWNHEDGTDVVCRQTRFRLEHSIVTLDITPSQIVVEEMTPELADSDCDERCEVDVSHAASGEAVAACDAGRFEQDGRGDVDTDGPHEGEHVIYHDWDHHWFDDDGDEAVVAGGNGEEVLGVVFELPGANEAEDAGFGAALGLLR